MSTSDRPWKLATIAVATVVLATACANQKTTWQSSPHSTASGLASPSPVASSSPSATVSAADACVATTMAKMTIKQIVGQIMLVGTPTSDPSSVNSVLRTLDIGGIFLNGQTHQSAAQLHKAIVALQAQAQAPAGTKLLIALDQEGGQVQTLQGSDFPPIPTAVDQGKLSQAALRKLSATWAGRLAAIGVNLDLAPVADTVPASLGKGNPPIGAFYREYGSDPTAVAADITTVVGAIQSTGVLTTLKHFPGLGRVKVNTDFNAGATDTVATSTDPYLGPFIAGIHAGTGAVMISSAAYPNLDTNSIATFSAPIVTDLLRFKLGFDGMIVSDSLAGAAAIAMVPVDQRGVRFIEAGGDLVLTTQAKKAPAIVSGLLAAAKASPAFTKQVTAAARYVLRAKYTAGLLGCSPPQA